MSWNQQAWESIIGQFWNQIDYLTWGDAYIDGFYEKLGIAAQSFKSSNQDLIIYNDYQVLALLEELEQLKTREKQYRSQKRHKEADVFKQRIEMLEHELGAIVHHLIYA